MMKASYPNMKSYRIVSKLYVRVCYMFPFEHHQDMVDCHFEAPFWVVVNTPQKGRSLQPLIFEGPSLLHEICGRTLGDGMLVNWP